MISRSKAEKKLIAIDLCSGAGGLSLGFSDAGFDVRVAVENDPRAAKIHKANFQKCRVVEKSIVGLTARTLREESGLGSSKVAVVFGGPPCQGFSLIGKRKEDDERSKILVEFARLAVELDPRIIVAENVKGVLMDWAKVRLDEFRAELEKAGYILLDPWVLNAADHGVPQRRESFPGCYQTRVGEAGNANPS